MLRSEAVVGRQHGGLEVGGARVGWFVGWAGGAGGYGVGFLRDGGCGADGCEEEDCGQHFRCCRTRILYSIRV